MSVTQQAVAKSPSISKVIDPTDVADDPGAVRSDGIRDTIESIVVAFILAFVFRAFMVEAFVIPTGSMAPGLNGLHARHRCSACQYPFAYGIKEDLKMPDGRTHRTLNASFSVRCPNCGFVGGGNSGLNTRDDPVIASAGDRILVLKWPYDIGGDLLGPKRWDVVVFKDPKDAETNYIKRLIGLPGEVLEIIDGDIYTAPADQVPADIREALGRLPPTSGTNKLRLSEAQQAALARMLRIQRKTPIAQESLWMNHYDQDFLPDRSLQSGFKFNPPAWKPEEPDQSGWNASAPKVRFEPPDDKEHWLRLVGRPIRDDYAYNDVFGPNSPEPRSVSVGDVRISFVLLPGLGHDGHIIMQLRKRQDEFRVTLFADGRVELARQDPGGFPIPLRSAKIQPFRAHHALSIEFENVDYRIALRVDGQEVVATDDTQYAPNTLALIREFGRVPAPEESIAAIRIAAAGIPLELHHLRVRRDVYYSSEHPTLDGLSLTNRRNPYEGYPGWGTTLNPIFLRSDPPDFFCLGDNSPQSLDSRLWWEVAPLLEARGNYQFGTVPGDQLIGKAFFVYWPSGIRFTKDTPAVIPDVGRMRMIR